MEAKIKEAEAAVLKAREDVDAAVLKAKEDIIQAKRQTSVRARDRAANRIQRTKDDARSTVIEAIAEANKNIQEAKAEAAKAKAEVATEKIKAEKDAELKIKEAKEKAQKQIEDAQAKAQRAKNKIRKTKEKAKKDVQIAKAEAAAAKTKENQKYKELVLNLTDIIDKLKTKLIENIGADDNFIVKLEKDLDNLARKVKTENAISLDVIESVVARYGNKGSEESKTVLATLWNLWTSVKENGMNVQETVLANKLQIFVIILVGVLLYYGFLSDSTQFDDAGTLNREGNEVFKIVKDEVGGDPEFRKNLETCGRNFRAEALKALKGAGGAAAAGGAANAVGGAVAPALESVSCIDHNRIWRRC